MGTKGRKDALAAASDAGLATARDELRALLAVAREVLPVIDALLGTKSAGRELIWLKGKPTDDLLPGALLVWLALRRDPTWYQISQVLTAMGSLAAGIRRPTTGGEEPQQ